MMNLLVASVIGLSSAAMERPVILTGEVRAVGSQEIIVPPSNSSPVLIRYFLAEGTAVKKGDVVLRIDNSGGQTETQITQQLEQLSMRSAKDAGNLHVSVLDSELAYALAEAALAKAKVDAKLPSKFLSALDFDRYQTELVRAQTDLSQKALAVAAAKVTLRNTQADAQKEREKLQIELAYTRALAARTEVLATVDGIVTHGFSEWRGVRIDEGESVQPGTQAGLVVAGTQREILAYALEADRPYLSIKQAVHVFVDAKPGLQIASEIIAIAQSPETRSVWGSGRYFPVRVGLGDEKNLGLAPGMSVRIELAAAARPITQADLSGAPATPPRIELEGEIGARIRSSIPPPSIKDVWQYTLMSLVPEGSFVSRDQAVAVFDGQQVRNQLDEKSRKLDEVQKQLKQLLLNHAELEKQTAIASAQARSDLEKAQRKANQPPGLIKRIDYDKLVIDRIYQARALALALAKQVALTRARLAEQREKSAELQLLGNDIIELKLAQAGLSVKPSNDGIVVHGQGFNGDKFTTGSQVFKGLSVAHVFDLKTLRVNATVAEADAAHVVLGQRASVRFGNAGANLDATVVTLGSVFRRKGRTQPSIVRDVTLEFVDMRALPAELKPGLAVRVSLARATPQLSVAGTGQ
jgi:multidrug resistance efflux pump